MAQREKLTEKLVRAAEPRPGIYQVFDEDVRGFSLRIFSSGSRHFALDYRVKGRQRRFTIGRCPWACYGGAPSRAGDPMKHDRTRLRCLSAAPRTRTRARHLIENGKR